MRDVLVQALGEITQTEVFLFRELKSAPNLLDMPYQDFCVLRDINLSIIENHEKEKELLAKANSGKTIKVR